MKNLIDNIKGMARKPLVKVIPYMVTVGMILGCGNGAEKEVKRLIEDKIKYVDDVTSSYKYIHEAFTKEDSSHAKDLTRLYIKEQIESYALIELDAIRNVHIDKILSKSERDSIHNEINLRQENIVKYLGELGENYDLLRSISGDFNKDGILDYFVLHTHNDGSGRSEEFHVSMGIGNGDDKYPDFETSQVSRHTNSNCDGLIDLICGDFNKDGNLDIKIFDKKGVCESALYLGDGKGTFKFLD